MDGPRLPSATVFYISIATSGETTSRCLFQRGKLCEKKFIICENNYSHANN